MTALVERCALCKHPITDDMSVLVDLEGTLTLVCFICDERAVEAANVGDPDDDC